MHNNPPNSLLKSADRRLTETYPAAAAENVTYIYDNAVGGSYGKGRLTLVQDQSGTTEFFYDALGRVFADWRTIAGKVYTTSYGYNAAGRLAVMVYPSGRYVNITRNANGQVTGITTKQSSGAGAVNVATDIGWKPMSDLVSTMTHGNGLATNAGYDLDHRLTSLQLVNGGNLVSGYGYSYADGINLTGITDQVAAANSNVLTYTPANRLASASGAWGNNAFSYDAVGNRVNDIVTGSVNQSRVASYGAANNRITGMSENGAAFRSYTYDAGGNIVSDQRPGELYQYVYNKRNRMSSVTRNGAAYATYVYNALEQLASRVTADPNGPTGTVHYIYDTDGHLIAEASAATGATTREYIWLPSNDTSNDTMAEDIAGAANDNVPDMPLALVEGTTLYQVHTDHLGRPNRVTDAVKATVWQATYKPWGQVESISGSILNNLRFPGQYFQLETNLAYNWHRSYDPTTGRYTQPDPLRFVDGPSVYAYAGSSPFMNIDREGRFWWIAGSFAIGTGMNVAGQLWDNGGDFSRVKVGCAIRAGIAGAALGGVGRYATGWAVKWKGLEFSHYMAKRLGGVRSLWNGNFVRISTHARSDASRYGFMSRIWRQKRGNEPFNIWGKHFFRIPRMPVALAGTALGGLISGCGCD